VAQPGGRSGGDGLVGQGIGGYEVEARIGSGATGVVYRAKNPEDGSSVAIKVLADDLGHIPSLERRFQREARALAKLRHPRIVHISDYGVDPSGTFIVMELLEGETLEQSLSDRPIEPQLALRLMRQVLDGVACAHAEQVVHRDLKPANVFLCEAPEGCVDAKVLDFGLAKFLSVDELSQDVTLTRRGRIVGTPAYMAPEQITGVSLDQRADVYALGVLLFELLADRRPFHYGRRSELLRAHLFEAPPWLADTRPGLVVHPDLERFVRRALAKDPDERFAGGGEMREALSAIDEESVYFTGLPPRAMPRSKAGTSSVLISAEERAEVSTGFGEDRAVVVTQSDPDTLHAPTPSSVEIHLGERAILTESEMAAVDLDELEPPQAEVSTDGEDEDVVFQRDTLAPSSEQSRRSTWSPPAQRKRSPATLAAASLLFALALAAAVAALLSWR